MAVGAALLITFIVALLIIAIGFHNPFSLSKTKDDAHFERELNKLYPNYRDYAALYETAAESVHNEILCVQEFHCLYKEASGGMSGFLVNSAVTTRWTSKAILHKRYLITLTIPVQFGAGRNRPRVVSYGAPIFRVNEISSVKDLGGGQVSVSFSGMNETFGQSEWNAIVSSSGDLGKFFDGIHKDRPVPGIHKYITQQ